MPRYTLRQHDNGVFYIHWTENSEDPVTGKITRRSKRASTSQTEDVAAQIFLGEWLKGEAVDATGAAPIYTFGELWDVYEKKQLTRNGVVPQPSTGNNLKAHLGALTLPEFAITNDAGFTPVEVYIALRREGKIGKCPAAPATVRDEISMARSCLNWCAHPKQKLIDPGAIPAFDIPEGSPPRDIWLRAEQIKALVDAMGELVAAGEAPKVMLTFLWLALETAARQGAILQLTRNRVDFQTGNIDYRKPGRRITKKRRAIVPMSAALRPILVDACKGLVGEDLICGGFPRQSYDYYLKKAATRAAVPIEHVSPHVLRHTAASHMLRNGTPIWIVARILADTVATVERVYAHHIPSDLSAGVEQIYSAAVLAGLAKETEPEPAE